MSDGLLKSFLYKYLRFGTHNNKMIQDKVETPLQGALSVKVTNHETGESYYHVKDHNTITSIYKRNVVRLLGNNNVSGRIITKMKFGSEGHDPNNPGNPSPTNAEMTALNNMFLTKQITTTSFEDDILNGITSVIFEVVLTTAEGNGSGTQIYSEAGLFTADETPLVDPVSGLANTGMVAVKHFGVLTKTSALSFTFQWRILL